MNYHNFLSTKYQIFRKKGILPLSIFSLAYEIRMGGWYKSRCISNHWDVRFCLSISSRTALMWQSIIISKGWAWLISIIFEFVSSYQRRFTWYVRNVSFHPLYLSGSNWDNDDYCCPCECEILSLGCKLISRWTSKSWPKDTL